MPNRPFNLTLVVGYGIVLVYLAVMLVFAMDGAVIVRQVEAEVGHELDCNEAYDHQEINDYFYPDRKFQGDFIYMGGLCLPVLVIAFAYLTVIGGQHMLGSGLKLPVKRTLLLVLGLGIVVFIALATYMPIITTIRCATD
ncbi:MAG TPA: hypothetical protein VHO69_02680 [Phototrophicaceae bacterium]|nr:hypothetical protein [Phototrophicaceae bacterium]